VRRAFRFVSSTDVFLIGTLAASLSCTGSIADGSNPGSSGSAGGATTGTAGARGGGGAGAPGTGGATGTAGATITAIPMTPGDPNAAGLMPMRRLTNREYNNTVHDLLGDTSAPANQFPSDRDVSFQFRRAGDLAVQDATLLRTAAETLAASAKAKVAPTMLLPCDPATAGEDACAQQFIAAFGKRAFRRPVAKDETTRLTSLYTAARTTLGLGFADAITVLIEAMLQSPQFLYHWEAPATDPSIHEGAVIRLSSYQIASRLSYFIWGSMPDDALLASAAAGQLDTAAGVQTATRRLLMDPKAKSTVSSFFSDWLELDGLPVRTKSAVAYPDYTPAVEAAMLDETNAFVQNVAFGGDGRLATFLGASYSYINQTLAGLYGATAMGPMVTKTDLPATQRAGLFTQGAFLALTGNAEGSNPVRRGKAVYTKLLCGIVPPPPPNVPPPMPASAGGTTRQRFTIHDQNQCAQGCHGLMDPIGFGFESYDGIGKYRTTDNGMPVDATGSITLDGVKHDFNGAVALVGLLAASPEVRSCFAAEWSRFALLRDTDATDTASLQSAAAAFASDTASIQDLMTAVSAMRSFRYRSPSPGEMQ
jgi:hypothetical protein